MLSYCSHIINILSRHDITSRAREELQSIEVWDQGHKMNALKYMFCAHIIRSIKFIIREEKRRWQKNKVSKNFLAGSFESTNSIFILSNENFVRSINLLSSIEILWNCSTFLLHLQRLLDCLGLTMCYQRTAGRQGLSGDWQQTFLMNMKFIALREEIALNW